MSRASTFFGGGGVNIGDMVFNTEMGTFDNTVAGQTRLRSGIAWPAGSYPLAATNPKTMINGVLATTWTGTAHSATGWAHNGSGTIVVAYNNGTNILRSTDYGVTWAVVAHNNSNSVTDVVWTGSQFISFGNSTTTITVSTSATGATWASGGSTAAVTTATASTVKAVYDTNNSVGVCAVNASTTACIATFTSAAVLTARTAAVATNNNPYIASLSTLGATRWIIASTSSTNRSSAADGSTWTSVGTLPTIGSLAVAGIAAGNGMFIASVGANGTTYATSTDGSTWTAKSTGGMFFLPNSNGGISNILFDGTRFVTSTGKSSGATIGEGGFGVTTDGSTWVVRQLTYPTTTNNTMLAVLSMGNNFVTVNSSKDATLTDTPQTSANWYTACDYVGKRGAVSLSTASVSLSVIGYVRIA